MKKCTNCFQEKPLDEFHKKSKARSHHGDGHENKCKECVLSIAKSPEKRERANLLRRLRGKTPRQKELDKQWAKTEKGQACEKRKNRKHYYANREERLSQMFIYRKTVGFKNAVDKYRESFPERRSANIAVMNALVCGKLTKPGYCSSCGIECNPEGHHPDYSKPLVVIWVCKKCHEDFHHR